ncbi:hypothetical protein GGS23DRAFT_575494 [Durotheca rogersii]|uniref:uncharacterized protein n=1 Tax=Durotheca rogersii TaxID=419775 RepID=UPI00221EC434|nr:uncharacterized protein GGS23DRAFT_575494 [Durotheca rogersii]KAI5861526.1 hypothetical protein GGS23DRAFT_575494 [Durotheca rogersii]
MASPVLAEITRRDLQGLPTPPVAAITDVKHLSSYSWLEAPTPTIAVPGSPALWSAPAGSQLVKKDSGLVYIAQNSARHPSSPLEPLFRSLYIENPSFDISSVDVVTDRNNIRKLLSFIDPSSSRSGLEPFTIKLEVTKNTVLFSRVEKVTYEIIAPHEFRGFGHEFEKAYTKNQIEDSTGHHRVISYRFGGLTLVVRCETDGYIGARMARSPSSKKGGDGDLSNLLSSLSLVPSNKSRAPAHVGSKLSVERDGQVVSLASTLEIKTRVAHKPLEFRDVASQLWLSQTPNLVRAYHVKGVFNRPEVENVASQIRAWEAAHQRDLTKLAALIARIIRAVKGRCRSAVVRYDIAGDKLVISSVPDSDVLPKDLYAKWDDRVGGAGLGTGTRERKRP